MKVIIRSINVRETQLMDKKTGQPVSEQLAELHVPGKVVPLEVRLRVGRNGATPVGEYSVDPESFQQGKWGSVDLRIRLGQKLGQTAQPASIQRAA